jgi:allophanate hydrolase
MGFCGVAVPSGFRRDGSPLGVTVLAEAFKDARAAVIAARFHRDTGPPLGASANSYPDLDEVPSSAAALTARRHLRHGLTHG